MLKDALNLRICSAILPVVLPLLQASAAEEVDENAAIRAFLQSPPPYSYEFSLITHVTWEGKAVEPKVIQGSWITDHTNWAQILPTATLSNSMSRGRIGSLGWYASGGDISTYDTEWNTNTSHPVYTMATFGRDMAYLVTRLGLEAVDFENARWSGAAFEADAALYLDTPGAKQWKVAGCISRKGQTEWELSLTNLQSGRLEGQSRVRGVLKDDGRFEPQQLEIFKLLDKHSDLAPQGWTKLVTLSLNRFTTLGDQIYAPSFHPLKNPAIKPKSYAFYTNEVLYRFPAYKMERLFSTDGTINYASAERVYTRDEIRRLRTPDYRKPIFLILIGVGLVASMFPLYRHKFCAGTPQSDTQSFKRGATSTNQTKNT